MNKFTRLTALLLALMMIFSTFAAAEGYSVDGMTQDAWTQIVQDAKDALFTVKEGGTPVELPPPEVLESKPYQNTDTVALSKGSWPMTTADLVTVESDMAGQWQIAIGETANAEGEAVTLWANLAGETGATLNVNAAMLAGSPSKTIRQVVYAEDGAATQVGTMTFTVAEHVPEAAAVTALYASARDGDTSTNDDVMTLEDANDTTTATVSILYQFSDGTTAASANGGNFPIGAVRNDSWSNPPITGYQVGGATVNGTEITLGADTDNDGIAVTAAQVSLSSYTLSADLTIVVTYVPAMVDYQIKYYFEPVDGGKHVEDANIKPHETVENGALTGSTVDVDPDVTLPGFTLLYYDKPEIAADGSTVVNVYYNRLSYLVNLDLAGGYGAEPVYGRYGSSYTIPDPQREGYTFEGWVLETAQDATPVKNLSGVIGTSNIKYVAKWTASTTSYQVVVWAENPNDTDYAFLASYNITNVTTGSTPAQTEAQVRAQLQNALSTDAYSELQYFTYDATLTTVDNADDNGGVKGDGSTVLNVKFKRNTYTLTFVANEITCTQEYHMHTEVGGSCYTLICDETEHVHTDACNPTPECGYEEHNHGTDGCELNNCDHPTHLLSCYYSRNGLKETSKPNESLTHIGDGVYTYKYYDYWTYYVVNIGDKWYTDNYNSERTITLTCTHSHDDECYDCGLTNHQHSESCMVYDCGLTTHQHDDACYNRTCNKTEHIHDDDCFNGSEKTVETITAKYGAYIYDEFPILDGKYTGYWWNDDGDVVYSSWVVSLDTMPGADVTFKGTFYGTDAKIYYYTEVLDDATSCDEEWQNIKYDLYKTVITVDSGYLTEDEEFHPIEGFTKGVYRPDGIFSSRPGVQPENYLYYTRNDYKLRFYNVNGYVDSTGQNTAAESTYETVQYEAPLAKYEITEPRYPYAEVGAYEFVGWYTTSGCYPGSEVDFDEATMPASDLTIYAKWQPKSHKVNVYMDDTLTQSLQAEQTVQHRGYATAPTTPTKENYEFVGWFYKDAAGNDKPFDFSMQVIQDMDIYAMWKTTQVQTFQVRYVYKDTATGNEIEIGDVTNGEGLVGTEVTFSAKTNTSLKDGYRTGYFPKVQSHSITIDEVADNNVYTFEYVHRDSVPYTVYYIIVDENGNAIGTAYDPYTNSDNQLSAVTEEFKPKPGYISWDQKYQKTLTVVADGQSTDANNNNVADYVDDPNTEAVEYENVIFFYYYEDPNNSQYIIRHMLQNANGVGYTEYEADTIIATAENGTVQGDDINDYPIHEYEKAEVILLKDNTKAVPTVDLANSPNVYYTLPEGGMEILIYYKLSVSTLQITKVVEDAADRAAPTDDVFTIQVKFTFGEGAAKPSKYTLNGDAAKDISWNADKTVATFTGIKADDVIIIQDVVIGTTYEVTETAGVEHYAWEVKYPGSGDTHAVAASGNEVVVTNTYLTGTLTINKTVSGTPDNESFIFKVAGPSFNGYVSITGRGSVTLTGLVLGEYTVTEQTDWSYRYTLNGDNGQSDTLTKDDLEGAVTFTNTEKDEKWLHDEAVKNNTINTK